MYSLGASAFDLRYGTAPFLDYDAVRDPKALPPFPAPRTAHEQQERVGDELLQELVPVADVAVASVIEHLAVVRAEHDDGLHETAYQA